jgi:diaminohydroxyphosphoribosylaminopyrimidine deaminase / 5-amino-6-(5-phosphoribosylamino)uracil reductase
LCLPEIHFRVQIKEYGMPLIQYFCIFLFKYIRTLSADELYMRRCLELARLGAGHTAPNPMVGAVLVFEGRIIGEGYHQQYGQAHAEVNCIRSVPAGDVHHIQQSILYVSLEPCAHYGKTPPCADLIIEKKIPAVVVGCRDPFKAVDGKGIEKLRAAGVVVEVGVLEKECMLLNKRFLTFHTLHRPYILLKWAQSANGRLAAGPVRHPGAMDQTETMDHSGIASHVGAGGGSRTLISNPYTNRLVHKWRSEEAAILVGTNTALSDDPALTARLWNGPHPIRLVVDKELRLPLSLQVFDRKVRTIVFNTLRHSMEEGRGQDPAGGGQDPAGSGSDSAGSGSDPAGNGSDPAGNLLYYQLATDSSLVQQIILALYRLNIQSVLVEGGARLLQSFIDEGYWDEARVITNEELQIPEGLASPELSDAELLSRERLFSDTICYYAPKQKGNM